MTFRHFEGATPILVACEGGHIEMASLLLLSGADPQETDREGRSPLSVVSPPLREQLRAILEGTEQKEA
jgi:ankyrin repeat protein